MEIKPPGTGQPVPPNPGAAESKPGKFESKVQRTGGESPASLSPAVSALKSRFSKRDLDDSSKLESIFNTAVRELMIDDLPQAAKLGDADKQFLTDWMAKDPMIQNKLLGFLRKVLD
jgi:hypothetical protein